MSKKIVLFMIYLAVAFMGFFALAKTSAAGTNLIANPSVETAGSTSTAPAGWASDKWGTNTVTFTYKSGDANTGTRSLYANMTARTSGDAKWYFTHLAVKPNQKYTYTEFYKSNVATEIDTEYLSTTSQYSYAYLTAPAASATAWKSVTSTFTTPANVKTMTVFHVIDKVGWLQTDDFSLVEGDGTTTPPAAPTISFSAPAAGATVSGTSQAVSANVSADTVGVQFKLDGNNLGAEDTTAPFSTTWNTTTAANGNHTLSAVARNGAALTATATETVNVQNTVTPTAPTVNFTAPAANSTVSDTVSISANASDTGGVAGVQFKVDNVNIGAEDTTAPYSVSWDSKTLVNGNHTLSAVARNNSGLTSTATETVNVQNAVTPTAPTVNFTAPAAGATVASTVSVSASASDTNGGGVAGVQFKVDNVNIGAEDTASPYSVSWDSKTVANGNHTLTAIARNASGLTSTATETVNVQNPTPPTISFSAPAAGATVSGTSQAVSANVSADTVGVQFKLDGNNLGAEDTTAPFSTTWNTTTAANGNHTLSAVARNGAALTATATETVNVQNTVTPPPQTGNLITNPSFETSSGTAPANWLSGSWGSNTSTFSYLTTGHTGTRSVRVDTTAYTNGAANWYYNGVPVTAGKTYKYENWYQSNVDTEVDAEVVMSDGSTQYYWLGTVLANTNWTKYSTTFTVPSGAKTLAIYQILGKKGYIVSDDYFLGEYTAVPFSRGLVSITFDDGWANQYQNAVPLLQKYGLISTFYIISGSLTDQPDYMTAAQVKSLYTAGHEIGSHTITHSDLTKASQTQLVNEMAQSQTTLQNAIGAPVTDFAYPYGAYNANTISVGKQYYQSQRTVNAGLNTKDNFDITTLKIYEVDSNISQAQVQGWVQAAIAQKSWLILVYHEIANTPVDPSDALYTTKPTDLDAELAYIKNSGVGVVTVHQALNEILPQL